MKTVCAWCGAVIKRGWPWEKGVSHGICPSCGRELKRQHLAGMRLRKEAEQRNIRRGVEVRH